MLEKAKDAVGGIKRSVQQKQLERKKQRAEKELEQRKAEQAHIEEEQEKINKEKERLSAMNTNELLAEAIMALRGFYSRFEELEDSYSYLTSKIEDLESEIGSLRSEIYSSSSGSDNDA